MKNLTLLLFTSVLALPVALAQTTSGALLEGANGISGGFDDHWSLTIPETTTPMPVPRNRYTNPPSTEIRPMGSGTLGGAGPRPDYLTGNADNSFYNTILEDLIERISDQDEKLEAQTELMESLSTLVLELKERIDRMENN